MLKKIIAFIIDVLIAFVGLGYIIALIFGGVREDGFSLQGPTAFILFALVIAYYVLCKKYLGQTLGRKIMGIDVKKF
jgi:uncharacterized RDD family membrane protein YckC